MRIKAGDFGADGARVLLDGVEQQLVAEANEERGWIIQFVTDASGKTVTHGDHMITRMRAGAVQIHFGAPYRREGQRVLLNSVR